MLAPRKFIGTHEYIKTWSDKNIITKKVIYGKKENKKSYMRYQTRVRQCEEIDIKYQAYRTADKKIGSETKRLKEEKLSTQTYEIAPRHMDVNNYL